MKRFYIAAVAGLCAVTAAGAQEGALAPTVPVVPAPALQNGSLVAPRGSWGASGPNLFSRNMWSPVRSPVVASDSGSTGYSTPPLPAGISSANGACATPGCGSSRGLSWERLKAWLCFRPSNTDLPRFQPTPYVNPLQGSLSCGSGCGYAGGNYPLTPPGVAVPPLQMQPPVQPSSGAGAVMMPSRGVQGGAVQSAWQPRPAPAPTVPALAGYRFATPENKAAQQPAQGPILNTGYRVPPK